MSSDSAVLVTGASGYIGSRLVAALLADGRDVAVAGRDTRALGRFDWAQKVRSVEMDVTDPRSCESAFGAAGAVDVAFYLVHAIGQNGYRDTDLDSARTFARAAREAGVRRIVYLGGFVPDDEELSEHLASRAEVADALAVDGVELVWLRAAIVLGAGSTSFELLRYLADRLPVVPLPSWLSEPVQPIAVDDVLRYLVASATDAVPAGAYDIAGPDVLPYRDLVFAYVTASGRHRLGVPAPGVPTALAAPVIGRLVPVPDALAEDLVASLNNSMTASEDRIRGFVPDPPGGRTTVPEAMRRALAGPDGEPVGVTATSDPLQLTVTDAAWTGGDEATIRRHGSEIASANGWRLLERLGVGKVLYRWPVAPVVRTNIDVVTSVAGKLAGAVRGIGAPRERGKEDRP